MSQIQQIKEATDIVQIIGERVSLQRSGAQYRGLCPFHGEKSPSFFVNEQFQRYKCFGCGESGDAFTFLEKYDGMTFGEALKYLADRAGIKLESFTPTDEDTTKQRLLSVLNLAKEYYHYLLTEHETGEPARAYLKERGVTAESIKVFQLGYALPAWDGLVTFLHKKKKYSLDDIQAAGLIVAGKGGRHYDRFRQRLMFPLTNHLGQVVGFSGRLLDSQAKEAKYINTPETSLYHKSKMLFGLSELYQNIRQKREVIVVEGEFDVISSAQAHVNHVVAIKGSALTADHATLLRRVADRVLLALDTDAAGVEATKKAIVIAQAAGIELRVIQIPAGKDPDELARTNQAAWRQASKTSVSVYEFFLQAALKKYDASTPEGKRHIMQELGPILATIPLAVERDVYIKKLAQALQVKESLVTQDMRLVGTVAVTKPKSTGKASEQPGYIESQPVTRQQKLERYLVFLLLRVPRDQFVNQWRLVADYPWDDAVAKTALLRLAEVDAKLDLKTALKHLPEDLQQRLFDRSSDPEYLAGLAKLDLATELSQTIREVQMESIKAQLERITKELDQLDQQTERSAADDQRQDDLLRQVVRLQTELQRHLK